MSKRYTVELSTMELKFVQEIQRDTGFTVVDILKFGVRWLHNYKPWPECSCDTLREYVTRELIKKDMRLEDWAEEHGFTVSSVNATIYKIQNNLPVGTQHQINRGENQVEGILSALQELIGDAVDIEDLKGVKE